MNYLSRIGILAFVAISKANWCKIGKYQSPVPLNENEAKFKVMPKIETYFYDLPYLVSLLNTGETVRVEFENESVTVDFHKEPVIPAISGGPLGSRRYILDQMHFHWDAEHTVNGHRYPLEAHFAHYIKNAETFDKSLEIREGAVILAVFYEFSENKPNEGFEEIVKNVKNISHPSNKPVAIKVNPSSLLPSEKQKYFSYKGSLTTPSCNEGVQWIIFYEPAYISKSQYQMLTTQIFSGENQLIKKNNRRMQPLNGREINISK